MIKKTYLFYKDFFKNKSLENYKIMLCKTKDSYLIGPKINDNFDRNSFSKRLKSNSIFYFNKYKNIKSKKRIKALLNYEKLLNDNEILEVFKNNKITIHKIIKVPGSEL